MTPKKKMNRRHFISAAATSTATISIVPRHVLGGRGHIAPSDKITVANIGCGTQGLREMPEMLENDQIQVISVCDVNKRSADYLDWSPDGIRNGIRKTLKDDAWGESYKGIPGGRDIGQEYVETFYSKIRKKSSYKGCTAYEDYRELLDKEIDLDAIKIMTPDHTHACIAIDAMKKGKHVITHKPIANRLREGRKVIDTVKETKVITHLLAWSDRADQLQMVKWLKEGAIGELKEIHNWSFRPVWPQWTRNPVDTPKIPDGFNWELWLGPVPNRPYHPNYTHNVFRGWYDFGGGSMADMGHYSLFPLFRNLGIDTTPVAVKAYGTTNRTVKNQVCRPVKNDVAFPYSCQFKFTFPAHGNLPKFDLYWYDGGMKPFAPPELEEDGLDVDSEGLMLVGEQGKILGGFLGEHPRLIPAKKMKAIHGDKPVPTAKRSRRSDMWAEAIKAKTESPGSFLNAGPITETINLSAVALRAQKRIVYDSANMKITNDENANKYLTRVYRTGWEM
ncbi:MAG: Gfo/Idh/MocA family oxidoreductase [Cytophagales bacterium]|nr:Gfo/Idh/MocA family oxidoreductase [Cytophagales bacterium]